MQHLARLKHPSIVRLVHPLEETRTQLVFITGACREPSLLHATLTHRGAVGTLIQLDAARYVHGMQHHLSGTTAGEARPAGKTAAWPGSTPSDDALLF